MEAAMGLLIVYYVFMLVMSVFASAVSIVFYVLMSLGMFDIAKRRGISKPWLAWVPFGSEWILGSISDQYQLAVNGKEKSRRKLLLGLPIAMYVAYALMMVAYFVMMFGAIAAETASGASSESAMLLPMLMLVVMMLFLVVMLVIAVVYSVYVYMALFDLFRSCNPGTSVLFLLLSIFLGINAVLVFIDRKKDLGMPVAGNGFEQLEPAE